MRKILSLFCIFLFVSFVPVVQAAEIVQTNKVSESDTGESIAVNARSYEPTVLTDNLLEDGSVPVYVFLAGSTLGTLLGSQTNLEPLYGNINIEKMQVKPQNIETADFIDGEPKWSAPNKLDLSHLGYLTLTLKQFNPDTSLVCNRDADCNPSYQCDTGACVPKSLNLSFTAKIWFTGAERLYSLSKTALILPMDQDEDIWRNKLTSYGSEYSFFGGRGLIRVKDITSTGVDLTVYSNKDLYWPIIGAPRAIADVHLDKGQTSDYYDLGTTDEQVLGNAKFRITLTDLKDPAQERAQIAVTVGGSRSQTVVTEGSSLYPGSTWMVKSITKTEGRSGQEFSITIKDSKGNVQTLTTSQGSGLSEDESVLLNKKFYQKPSTTDCTSTICYDLASKTINPTPLNALGDVFARLGIGVDLSSISQDVVKTNPVTLQDGETLKQVLLQMLPSGYYYSVEKKDLLGIKKFASIDPCANANIYTVDGLADTLKTVTDSQKIDNGLKLDILCSGIDQFQQVVLTYDSETLPDTGDSVVDESYLSIGKSYDTIAHMDSLTMEEKQGALQKELAAYQKLVDRHSSLADESVTDTITSLTAELFGDSTYGRASLQDNTQLIYVELLSLQELTADESSSVTLTKNGLQSTYHIGEALFSGLQDAKGNAYNWYVYSISDTSVQLRSVYTSKGTLITTKTLNSDSGGDVIEGNSLKIVSIDTKKEAYLTITPGTGEALTSTSNFTVHIPVEKRAINLNPSQIDNQIALAKALQKKLDSATTFLEKLVKTWNYVCLGVFAFVSLKSSFASASSIARHDAVHGVDDQSGWAAYCEEQSSGDYSKRQYKTYDDCMLAHAQEIENDIQAAQTAQSTISSTKDYSTQLSDITTGYTDLKECQNLLGDQVFLDQKSQADYAYLKELDASSSLSDIMRKSVEDKIESYKGTGSNTAYQTAKQEGCNKVHEALITQQNDVLKDLSGDQLANKEKEIASGVYESAYDASIARSKQDSQNQNLEGGEISTSKAFPSLNIKYLGETSIQSVGKVFGGQTSNSYTVYSTASGSVGKAIPVTVLTINDYQQILITRVGGENNILRDKGEVTGLKDRTVCLASYDDATCQKFETDLRAIEKYTSSERVTGLVADDGARFYKDTTNQIYVGQAAYATGSLSTTYAKNAKVEIYDSGAYKGLPYCLPYKDGNYIQFLSYTANNEIDTMELWNVGSDGQLCTKDDVLVEHESELHYNTASPNYNTLVTFANPWVKKTYYQDEVVSPDNKNQFTVSYGKSHKVQDGATASCFDVMDPGDCKLLFDTCDPVMCPSSRFNLGGRYQVSDVVQSGIIGSVVLPQGSGDPVPLCLTGILASLQFWKSMLDGYVECLNSAKYEGKSIGICDKLRSVYTCELITREVAAIMDNNKDGLLDFLSNGVYGQKDTGGGEYLNGFKNSLANVQNSVSYFTTEYATTAFAAFKGRSLDEVGTTICQQAIYGQVPGVSNFMEQLTTPEDPNQFYATLKVKPYAPSLGTNAYSTYYHLYAGTNANIPNVVYQVYLKNSLTGEIYHVTDSCGGVSGSLELGGSDDKNLDCLAPEGFDTVCVVMNGQTTCGFGSVSTAFAEQYVKDSLVTDELKKDITTEKDCYPTASTASPTVSKLSTFGSTDSLPLPYNYGELSTGIQRVCSLQNPGLGQSGSGTWSAIGTCGNDAEGRSLGYCWVNTDSYSIKDAQRSETANQLLETKNFDVLKSGLENVMDADTSAKAYTQYLMDFDPTKGCASYLSLMQEMKRLYDETLSYQYSAAAQFKIGYFFYLIGTNEKPATGNNCGITGRTEISYDAQISAGTSGSSDSVSVDLQTETSVYNKNFKGKTGTFSITFHNLLSGESATGIVDTGTSSVPLACGPVSSGDVTCTGALDFTNVDTIPISVQVMNGQTSSFEEMFTISAVGDTSSTSSSVFTASSQTCDANCGAGIFNLCDKDECNSINSQCYYSQAYLIGSCSACSEITKSTKTDKCTVLGDDKERCTSSTCYSQFLASGEKCYWDDTKGCTATAPAGATGGGSTGVVSGSCIATGGADAYENALLDMIASGEGAYNSLSGGGTFDMSQCATIGHPWDIAAGRYQFISSTYNDLKGKGQFLNGNFCQDAQDKAALQLVADAGITDEIIQQAYQTPSTWQTAILDKLAPTWASFPVSSCSVCSSPSCDRSTTKNCCSSGNLGKGCYYQASKTATDLFNTFNACYKEHTGVSSSSSSSLSSSQSTTATATSSSSSQSTTTSSLADMSGVSELSPSADLIIQADEPYLESEPAAALQVVAQNFYLDNNGVAVVVSDAARTLTEQAQLVYDNCLVNPGGKCTPATCNAASGSSVISGSSTAYTLKGSLGGLTATASNENLIVSTLVENSNKNNCPHTSLIAVDLWCDDGGYSYVHDPQCQARLTQAMVDAGFCRLDREAWHFEWDASQIEGTSCSTRADPSYISGGTSYDPTANDCALWDYSSNVCVR